METESKKQKPIPQSIELGLSTNDSGYIPTASNSNSVQNIIHGPGNIFNYNSNFTEVRNVDPLLGLNATQIRITAVLKMRHVPEAVYDAQPGPGCMDGTRIEVLREIENWIQDFSLPAIFWLTGMVGSGKTTIASTVSSLADKDPVVVLGGSFFCSRSAGSQGQRDVRCVIPTLAQLLARQSIEFSHTLAHELDRDPDVLHKQVAVQVEKLLHKPLTSLKNSLGPILFVIDAIDECGGRLTGNETSDIGDLDSHRVVSDMLEALVSFSRSPERLPVKFFITSRPETHIRDTPISNAAFSKVLRLHTVNKDQVTADIRLYIAARLTSTEQLRSQFLHDDINMLVRLCDGLFIVAATALEYTLGAGTDRAPLRFRRLLNATGDGLSAGAIAPLDRVYAVILADAVELDGDQAEELATLLRLLASILSARMTLSVAALADLSDISPKHLRATLSNMHSVVHVPENDKEPGLRTLHASFGDYLLERAEHGIRLERSLGEGILARGCFKVMVAQLYFNVSQSQSSYKPNPREKPDQITLSLEYACLHWIYHASRLPDLPSPDETRTESLRQRIMSWIPRLSTPSQLDKRISKVFRPRLLFWLEVMSLLGQVPRAAAMLMFAAGTVKSPDLSQFLRDANSFVASSQQAIKRSAPHIYLSALPFAAKDSLAYQEFAPLCTGLIAVDVFGMDHHAGRLVMTLAGHESDVTSVAFSPDGGLVASGSTDRTVRIWDTRTGEETMAALYGDNSSILSVAFAPQGTGVAAGTEEGLVCVWRIVAGRTSLRRLEGHSNAVSSVAFSPNGSLLASASNDRTVRLWSTETDQLHAILSGHAGTVNVVDFSPTEEILASGSDDRTIRFWQPETGRQLRKAAHGHGHAIYSLCFARDGKKIAIGAGRDVAFCKPTTGKSIATLRVGFEWIRAIGFSPSGQSLVSAHGLSICVSALPRFGGKVSTVVLGGHTKDVHYVTFSSDGLYIASASADCTVRILSAVSGQSAAELLKRHEGFAPLSAVVSPDGNIIVSGSRDGSIHIWDVQTGEQCRPRLLGHSKMVFCVTMSSDGRLLASASEDQTVRLWDFLTGDEICKPLRGHTSSVNTVAFSPDTQWIASGSDDGTVRVWGIDGRPLVISPLLCGDMVGSIGISPDGTIIVAGDANGYIYAWDATSGERVRDRFRHSSEAILSIAFSPDGERVASGGQGAYVHVWDVFAGQQVLNLQGHKGWVRSVTYSFDGRLIASGSSDQTCRLWDAETGAPIAVYHGHTGRVLTVVFTPDDQSIILCDDYKSIRALSLNVSPSIAPSCEGEFAETLASATLDDEGWITGPLGELLIWVPTEYRKYLPLHPCRIHIAARGINIVVGDSGWNRGESWTSCWLQTETSGLPGFVGPCSRLSEMDK